MWIETVFCPFTRQARKSPAKVSRPDPKTLCRYCGEPLPPREPNKRGRPAVTHAGTCRKLYTNQHNLQYRIDRYRAAMEIQADRSTFIPPWIRTVYDHDEIAEGFSPIAAEPLWGAPLMRAVEAWEAEERERKLREQVDRALIQRERNIRRADATRRFGALDPQTRDALVAHAVLRRLRNISYR